MAGRHDANARVTSRAAAKTCAWGSVRVPESAKGALTPASSKRNSKRLSGLYNCDRSENRTFSTESVDLRRSQFPSGTVLARLSPSGSARLPLSLIDRNPTQYCRYVDRPAMAAPVEAVRQGSLREADLAPCLNHSNLIISDGHLLRPDRQSSTQFRRRRIRAGRRAHVM
jgi:hypothetical protein